MSEFTPRWFSAEADRLRAENEHLRTERTELRQALWDVYGILGFDQDGDKTPDALVHPALPDLLRDAAEEFRRDYDELLTELPERPPWQAALAAEVVGSAPESVVVLEPRRWGRAPAPPASDEDALRAARSVLTDPQEERMTAHTCRGFTPGCYRCDLDRDEVLHATPRWSDDDIFDACNELGWVDHDMALLVSMLQELAAPPDPQETP